MTTRRRFAQRLSPDERLEGIEYLRRALETALEEAESYECEDDKDGIRSTLKSAIAYAYGCDEDDVFDIAVDIERIAQAAADGVDMPSIANWISDNIESCRSALEYVSDLVAQEDRWERDQADHDYEHARLVFG